MSAAPPKKDPAAVEAEVREKIHLEILKRTGAYHANDHVLLPSGQHTTEYIEKTLVTTEPSFTEGLGAVIAKHFAQWPVDVVLSTGAAPGYFAILFGRLVGARTIWLDSIANVEQVSMSGQMVRRHADLWLTQWPHLAHEDGPECAGRVF